MRTTTLLTLLPLTWLAACGSKGPAAAGPRDAGAETQAPPDAAGAEPEPDAANTTPDDRVGPVDLTLAPASVAMTCDGAAGTVTLVQPCLVGMDLRAAGEMVPGIHAVECRLADGAHPLAWSFLLPMAMVAHDPGHVLQIPGESPTVPNLADSITLGSVQAKLTTVTGGVTFSRVDPVGRAFAATIDAKAVWKPTSGPDITCDLRGPLWGAPGDFL